MSILSWALAKSVETLAGLETYLLILRVDKFRFKAACSVEVWKRARLRANFEFSKLLSVSFAPNGHQLQSRYQIEIHLTFEVRALTFVVASERCAIENVRFAAPLLTISSPEQVQAVVGRAESWLLYSKPGLSQCFFCLLVATALIRTN